MVDIRKVRDTHTTALVFNNPVSMRRGAKYSIDPVQMLLKWDVLVIEHHM